MSELEKAIQEVAKASDEACLALDALHKAQEHSKACEELYKRAKGHLESVVTQSWYDLCRVK